jgi:hypothetical protein
MLARILSALLGAWLMAVPDVLDYTGAARINDSVVGPTVLGFSFIAAWQLMRSLRWVELVAGVWLLVAPWALGYELVPIVNSIVVGILLISFALVRGKVEQRFGGGWSSLWRGEFEQGGDDGRR